MLSPEGEYVQTVQGKKLLEDLQTDMANKDCPVVWQGQHLRIHDVLTLYKVCCLHDY